MKFACSTGIFRGRPLAEALEGIAQGGFTAVEIVADRPHAFPDDFNAARLAAVNEILGRHKLKVCGFNSCVVTSMPDSHNPLWIEEDWESRERRLKYTLDCMRMAATMGVPRVVTLAAGSLSMFMNREEGLRLFAAYLKRVVSPARKLGVRLLIEPEPGMLLETAEQTLEFLNDPAFEKEFGICFDVGHFFCAGEDPCAAWGKLNSQVECIHLSDISSNRSHRHIQLGEGDMDLPRFLHCVNESGYSGPVVVKLDSYDQRTGEIVAGAAGYLRKHGFMAVRETVREEGTG